MAKVSIPLERFKNSGGKQTGILHQSIPRVAIPSDGNAPRAMPGKRQSVQIVIASYQHKAAETHNCMSPHFAM